MTLPRLKIGKIKLTGINALNLVGAFVIIYLVVVLAQTVRHNYQLGRQIDILKVQTTLLQAQKDQLSYNIQYYNTEAFRDREARSKLGLQLPGENAIIIPRTSPAPTPSTAAPKTTSQHSNPRQWFDFLVGRTSR